MSKQKQFNQDEMNLKYFFNLSSIRTYTKENFQNVNILKRAFRLLFHRRYE